ncbi:MAG TPA: hypothetical protein PKV27_13945, partial [Ilumatobacteraceae bacterium]|nr:hypothetical protein [Ilumatobacteraceae bacterium]
APNLDGVRTGLHHWWPRDAEQLVSTLAERWSAPRSDPFAFDLAIGAEDKRMLSQLDGVLPLDQTTLVSVQADKASVEWRRQLIAYMAV